MKLPDTSPREDCRRSEPQFEPRDARSSLSREPAGWAALSEQHSSEVPLGAAAFAGGLSLIRLRHWSRVGGGSSRLKERSTYEAESLERFLVKISWFALSPVLLSL